MTTPHAARERTRICILYTCAHFISNSPNKEIGDKQQFEATQVLASSVYQHSTATMQDQLKEIDQHIEDMQKENINEEIPNEIDSRKSKSGPDSENSEQTEHSEKQPAAIFCHRVNNFLFYNRSEKIKFNNYSVYTTLRIPKAVFEKNFLQEATSDQHSDTMSMNYQCFGGLVEIPVGFGCKVDSDLYTEQSAMEFFILGFCWNEQYKNADRARALIRVLNSDSFYVVPLQHLRFPLEALNCTINLEASLPLFGAWIDKVTTGEISVAEAILPLSKCKSRTRPSSQRSASLVASSRIKDQSPSKENTRGVEKPEKPRANDANEDTLIIGRNTTGKNSPDLSKVYKAIAGLQKQIDSLKENDISNTKKIGDAISRTQALEKKMKSSTLKIEEKSNSTKKAKFEVKMESGTQPIDAPTANYGQAPGINDLNFLIQQAVQNAFAQVANPQQVPPHLYHYQTAPAPLPLLSSGLPFGHFGQVSTQQQQGSVPPHVQLGNPPFMQTPQQGYRPF